MADNDIPQSIANKPVERVVISHPYTARLVELAKRLDRILRHADDRFARSQMSENRYESVRRQTRDALQSVEQKLSDLDNNSSRRRGLTRRSNANSPAVNGKADPKGGNTNNAKQAAPEQAASPTGKSKSPDRKGKSDRTANQAAAPASSSTSADAAEGPGF